MSNHAKVKRYHWDRDAMCEVDCGEFVDYADYQKLEQQRDELVEALKELTGVIDAARLENLRTGVQLGSTSWYVKASSAMEFCKKAIARAGGL